VIFVAVKDWQQRNSRDAVVFLLSHT